MRGFIGLLQFFRRFIYYFAKISTALTNLTRKNSRINIWNKKCDLAFENLKEKLCSSPIMASPNWSKLFCCHVDASKIAVGVTLTQLDLLGHEIAIAYFSIRLSPTEENYSTNDRELLGLIYFLQIFVFYLEGSELEVLMDNQVLRRFFSKPNMSRKKARWIDFLGQLGITKLTLVKGKVHVLGDAFSRAPQIASSKHLHKNAIQIHKLELQLPPGFVQN